MKIRRLLLAAALALAAAPLAALAQASAPPPVGAASAPPPAAKTGPRLLTPAQSRDSATTAGDLRPERRVTPQVSIPLGKKPPAPTQPKPRSGATPQDNPAAPGSINDAAARCEAQVGEQVRAKCRDKLAREARARPPG